MVLPLQACQPDHHNTPASPAQELERMLGLCVQQMVSNTCSVMKDAPQSPKPGSYVLIAGIGRVDAQAYEAIRQSGEAMCEQVKRQCQADWNGPSCRTARQLWSTNTP